MGELVIVLLAAALAAPMELPHTGRLLDAAGGPINDTVTLTVTLHETEGGPASYTEEHRDLPLRDGFYAIRIGANTPLSSDVVVDARWLAISVDGAPMGAQPLGSTPFAVTATTVEDTAVLDVAGLSVAGDPVVTASSDIPYSRITGAYERDGSEQRKAAHSCAALHDTHPSLPSGRYWVDPNGGGSQDAWEAYCDMTYAGGGWTLVGVDVYGTDAGRLQTGTNVTGYQVRTCTTVQRSWTESCWRVAPELLGHQTNVLVKAGRDLAGGGTQFDDQLAFHRLRLVDNQSTSRAYGMIVGNQLWTGGFGQIYNFDTAGWEGVASGNANHHSQISHGGGWIHWNTANLTSSGTRSTAWGRNDVGTAYADPSVGDRSNQSTNAPGMMLEVYLR